MQVVCLIIAEAALTTSLGGVCGAVLGAGGLALFERTLGHLFQQYQVPFALPGLLFMLGTGVMSELLCACVGMLGVASPPGKPGVPSLMHWCAGKAPDDCLCTRSLPNLRDTARPDRRR